MGEADRQRCVGRQWADANACLSSGLLGSPRPMKGRRRLGPGAPSTLLRGPTQDRQHHSESIAAPLPSCLLPPGEYGCMRLPLPPQAQGDSCLTTGVQQEPARPPYRPAQGQNGRGHEGTAMFLHTYDIRPPGIRAAYSSQEIHLTLLFPLCKCSVKLFCFSSMAVFKLKGIWGEGGNAASLSLSFQ